MAERGIRPKRRRPRVGRAVEREVWVRAAGRCAICNRHLLDDDTGWITSLGEVAHNVAAGGEGTRAQRADDSMPAADRNTTENLVLLCQEHHEIVDAYGAEAVFDSDRMRDIKRQHESDVRYLTGLRGSRRTAVLRLRAPVQGVQVEIDKRQVIEAVLASGWYPDYPWGNDRIGDLIDLAHHDPASPSGLRAAAGEVERRLQALSAAIRDSEVNHLSVFAYAPTPLLIHLGYVLDDTIDCDIYQRHRRTQNWTWDDDTEAYAFTLQAPSGAARADEALLVVNASGTIHPDELPQHLRHAQRFLIEPAGMAPSADLGANRETMANFAAILRQFFGTLERTVKPRHLHLVTAAPIALLVTLGRVVDKSLGLRLHVYERRPINDTIAYIETTEIPLP